MARCYGYSRVSTSDQDWSLQLEALTKAGVDDRDIFRETASGAKRDRTGCWRRARARPVSQRVSGLTKRAVKTALRRRCDTDHAQSAKDNADPARWF